MEVRLKIHHDPVWRYRILGTHPFFSCNIALTQGRDHGRHNEVLRELANTMEIERKG
jgi:hypothetical protein